MKSTPKVITGLIETEEGRVFELESSKGAEWLNTIKSFIYVPKSSLPEFTVRKEGKGDMYWYGYRRTQGKLQKKYIGKILEVSPGRLEALALELEHQAEKQALKPVTEVKKTKTAKRLELLEEEVSKLKAVIVKDNQEVTESVSTELHNDLGNFEELEKLRAENEALKAEVKKLRAEIFDNNQIISELQYTNDKIKEALHREENNRQELENKLAAKNEPEAAELVNKLKNKRK